MSRPHLGLEGPQPTDQAGFHIPCQAPGNAMMAAGTGICASAPYRFTVFTPTYNRARSLYRVYEALQVQTFTDFEWLIVDGGNDDTAALVAEWAQNARFPIRYFRQVDPGLHVAYNEGAREARGQFFLSLHSDDSCEANALERFAAHWDAIPGPVADQYSGVWSLCRNQFGKVVGGRLPEPVMDATYQEMQYRIGFRWEMWPLVRTDVIRQFPYPEVRGLRFIPEGYVWRAIGERFRTRFIDEALRIYWEHDPAEEAADHLMDPLTAIKNSRAATMFLGMTLQRDMRWFRYAPIRFARYACQFVRFSLHSGQSASEQLKTLGPAARALCLIMFPAGTLLARRDRRQAALGAALD